MTILAKITFSPESMHHVYLSKERCCIEGPISQPAPGRLQHLEVGLCPEYEEPLCFGYSTIVEEELFSLGSLWYLSGRASWSRVAGCTGSASVRARSCCIVCFRLSSFGSLLALPSDIICTLSLTMWCEVSCDFRALHLMPDFVSKQLTSWSLGTWACSFVRFTTYMPLV